MIVFSESTMSLLAMLSTNTHTHTHTHVWVCEGCADYMMVYLNFSHHEKKKKVYEYVTLHFFSLF